MVKGVFVVCLVIAEPTPPPPETVGRGFHLYGGFRPFACGSAENRILGLGLQTADLAFVNEQR